MIIRSEHLSALQDVAEAGFEEQLRVRLGGRYPHILGRFPVAVQKIIVTNMLGRAKRWGLSWPSSLTCFAELMLAIAPNFDQERRIQEALSEESSEVDEALLNLGTTVPQSTWSDAERSVADLPLFVHPELETADVAQQTSSAIGVVLWDADISETPRLATNSIVLAEEFGMSDVPDAPVTLAAWRVLYGPSFRDARRYRWVSDVMKQQNAPRRAVAMLKYRIALDFGRFV